MARRFQRTMAAILGDFKCPLIYKIVDRVIALELTVYKIVFQYINRQSVY